MKKLFLPILVLLLLGLYIAYREYLIAQIKISTEYSFKEEYEETQKQIVEKAKFEKIKKISMLNNDESITKFVNNKVPFQDVSYIPGDLVSIDSDYVIDSKGNGELRMIANENLQKLAKVFSKEMGVKLTIVSSYRSYAYQKGIKERGCPDNLCAKAGYSEHQTGLAVDIFSASNQSTWNNDTTLSSYYEWFVKNAHNYGFTNTYQKGLEVDGYEIEPWHWRYVGVLLAIELKNANQTLAEYYEINK